jgi:hypothetical protein
MASAYGNVALLSEALALISAEHRAAVLAHPQWIDIAREPTPARQLVWMVRQGLLTYDELDELQTFDEAPSAGDRIVQDAFAELCSPDAHANRRLPEGLRSDEPACSPGP